MDLLGFGQQDDELFEEDGSQDFSIEQETQQLMNEVFSSNYSPVYDPAKSKQTEQQLVRKKKQVNSQLRKRGQGHHRIYQNIEGEGLSESFSKFLHRAQEKVDQRNRWLDRELVKKQQKQARCMREVPEIVRGSRQKVPPIYQRCIDLQKNQQQRLQNRRVAQFKKEVEQAQSYRYRPDVISYGNQRPFEQYLAEKEIWMRQKEEQLQKKRVQMQVKNLSQCTFTPILVTARRPQQRMNQRVEDRLLRSLKRSKRQ